MKLRDQGYTIIELLVVMAVLGLLAAAATPMMELTAKRAKERELKQALAEIRQALDAYKEAGDTGRIVVPTGASGYPPSLPALVAGVPDAKTPGRTMYFLRRIPRDPFAPAGTPPEAGWGLRSYASPPDRPQRGEDVYDVYSLADGIGMNGVPYQQW